MQGSYEQNPNNKLWSVRFRIMENGKEVNKRLSGFKTKREAAAALREYLTKHINEKEPATKITFVQLYTEYKSYAKLRQKDSSWYENMKKFERLVLPAFENKYIADITPKDILQWQNSLSEKNYSYKYKVSLRWLLRSLLTYGQRYYDLPNCIDKVEGFRNSDIKKEMLCWTPQEFGKFISVVDKPDLHAYFMFLYFTGARKGEVQALAWGDIDFDTKTVRIEKSITRKVLDKAWAITTPKNQSSVRRITLPDVLIVELVNYRDWQKSNCKKIHFVFGGAIPLNEQYIVRNLKNYCTIAQVKVIRQHDFRHSHASVLLSQGLSVTAVARRLGHSNITQTLNTYSHLMPDDDAKLKNILNNI